jgi:hypothetical protein
VITSVPSPARASTRSDYAIVCLDLMQTDPGMAIYPYSENSSIGSRVAGAGSFAWDLFSSGWMPGKGVPLTQGADAWAGFDNVTIPFGPGCQFFSGNQSRILVRGINPSTPGAFGTAPAQILVSYHVILETEYLGTGASVAATNGVNVIGKTVFDFANLSLTSTGGEPVLDVPEGATVTDVSIDQLTRKEVSGVMVVSDILSYGMGVVNEIDITFFAGSQASAVDTSTVLTGEAGSMGSQTATTEVMSLDPNVVFTVVPEPAASALGAAAIACLGAISRRARRQR